MLFYFLISIVFIAEIIIVSAIMIVLVKCDKKIIEYNSLTNELKPLIKDIMITGRKLSEQFLNIAPIAAQIIKKIAMDFVTGQLKNALGAITFWLVKKEVEKHV